MLHVPLWVQVATVAGFLAVIGLDVLLSVRRPHVPSAREAAGWAGAYVAGALLFATGLGLTSGWRWSGEFVAGWLTEYSLSVDNLFVFALILSSFAVPRAQQQKVLLWGIVGALALRAGLIAAGAAALQRFSATFYVFGAVLLVAAGQLLRQREHGPDPRRNPVWRALRRLVPTTDDYDGARLVTRREGRRVATPLLLVTASVGTADVLFALDSIPAIYGLTREPYLVLAGNAFALMGLRQLYFLLAGLLGRLVYLRHGLAVILAFIGGKLVLEAAHEQLPAVPHIPVSVSLAVICGVLAASTAASLLRTRRPARAGPAAVPAASPVREPVHPWSAT